MKPEPLNERLAQEVTKQLVAAGWSANTGTALAHKTFTTAVGPKQAFAYLADYGSESSSVLLQGDFRSEGRNQLEADAVLIPKDSDTEAVRAQVTLFAHRADNTVARTYAAGLALRHPELAQV